MPCRISSCSRYPPHTPRWAPPRDALLMTPDIRALGRISEWARSAGCALCVTPGPKITRPPGWLVVARDAMDDPDTMIDRLTTFRMRHPETQVMLVSAGAGVSPAPHPDLPICDVALPDPASYDVIETAVRMMHVNNLLWRTQRQPRALLA